MRIEPYPIFRPLDISDKSIFDYAFAKTPPRISEFTFTNLYCWREAYKLSVSTIDGALLVRSDRGRAPEFFAPIGSTDVRVVIIHVLQKSGGSFIRIPDSMASVVKDDARVTVDNDGDNSDYLYRMEDLVSLAGKKYDGKRNLIRKFSSEHQFAYEPLNSGVVDEALEFEEAWCSIKDCDGVEELGNERSAIRQMAENFELFHLSGGAIRVNGAFGAIALAEPLNPHTLVMHVLKADPEMTGLYQVMLNEFLSRHAQGLEYVNLEQDLGIEGLRKSKLSYHPTDIVKKYTIQLSK